VSKLVDYEGYPESKDARLVKMQGILFFFQKWQCCRVRDRNRMTGQNTPATVTATLCSHYVFKMAVSIRNPAECEIRAVIRFLHATGETAAEIHRQLISVYGEDVMNRQDMAKWCREIEAGRSDVHDEGHSLSLMKSSKKMMKTFALRDV
jgi:hypothetical protein